MLLTQWDERRRGVRTGRRERTETDVARRRATARARALLDDERTARETNLPAPDAALAIAAGRLSGIGELQPVWPVQLRLGHGRSTSRHVLTQPPDARRSLTLDDAPVPLTLPRGAVVHLDVTDDVVEPLLENLAAHLAVGGTPGGVRPVVVSPLVTGERWEWWHDSPRLECTTGVPARLNELLDEAGTNPMAHADRLPIVLLDARVSTAGDLARRWHALGSGALVVVRHTVNAQASPWLLRPGHDESRTDDGHAFTLDHPDATWFPTLARLLRRWSAPAAKGGASRLPDRVLPHHLLDDVALETRWKQGPGWGVPLGISDEGTHELDLVRHGPHALVAGTTGSGKSELLLAYLRGLFTLNSPEHATTLLIDYKGGATFGPLVDAPHVVGLVTDLDEGLAARALIALRAEINRREHLLARAGFSSYTAYAAARLAGNDGDPLPRFFVIVDEFRVLAEELPDFVAGLVRLAAVGRSLGMHLVLATQRPGGPVTADMRANLDLRVALRVRERVDSIDVLDSPLAAAIDRRTPGRAYIAHGGEAPLEVQTMFTGAPRPHTPCAEVLHVHPVERPGAGTHHVMDRTEIDPAGDQNTSDQNLDGRNMDGRAHDRRALPPCAGCRPEATSAESDLALFTAEAVLAARDLPAPHRPLLPPLPDVVRTPPRAMPDGSVSTISLTTLNDRTPRAAHASGAARGTEESPHDADAPARITRRARPFAVADLPHDQSQPLVLLDPTGQVGIAGAPRSGRTSAAVALAGAHEGEVCWVGTALPDTCALTPAWHVDPLDANDVVGLLTALDGENLDALPRVEDVDPRGDQQTDPFEGATDWNERVHVGAARNVLIVIDEWETLYESLLRINHGLGVEEMLAHVAGAHQNGRRFVVTGGRLVIASKLASLLETRIVLRHNDASDYSMAGLRPAQVPAHMPPERGLVLPHAHAVQFMAPPPRHSSEDVEASRAA